MMTQEKHGHPQSRIDRYTDNIWHWIALLSGNGGAGRTWRITARAACLAAGPLLGLNNALFTCEMKNTVDRVTAVCGTPWILRGIAAAMTLASIAVMIINERVSTPEKKQLIRELRSPQDRGTFARACTSIATASIVSLFVLTPLNLRREIGMRMESEALAHRPSYRAGAVAVHVLYIILCQFMLATMFTALRHAATWLSATRHAIKRFAKEVHAVAEASTMAVAADATAVAADAEAPAATAAAIEEGVPAIAAVPIVPDRTQANTAKVQRSFEAAWRISQATNEIFALSLSYMFARQNFCRPRFFWRCVRRAVWLIFCARVLCQQVMCFSVGVYMGIFIIYFGRASEIIFWSLVIFLISIAILVWVSTPGDEFQHAQASLLRPDTSLGLMKALGPHGHAVFAQSLRGTRLGFELVNVVVSTSRVLYVVFSIAIMAIYVIPKN